MLLLFSHYVMSETPVIPWTLSIHGISQVRILEWVAIFSSRRSSQARDWNCISWISFIGREILYFWTTWEALPYVVFISPPDPWVIEYYKILLMGKMKLEEAVICPKSNT